MALNASALVVSANALAADITHFSIHTAGAVTLSTSESAAARRPVTWTVSAAGVMTLSAAAAFTGGAASGPAIRVGYWTAVTAGTYRGGFLLTGDQAFNQAGQYTVTSATETPTSS